MKILKSIIDKKEYSKSIQKEIELFFYEVIFSPLFDIIEINLKNIKENSRIEDIEKALKDGSLNFVGGQFTGSFNAKVSKQLRDLGAIYNRANNTFTLNPIQLPLKLKILITQTNLLTKEKFIAINDTLKTMQDNIINYKEPFVELNKSIKEILTDLDKQAKNVLKDIAIPADLTEDMKNIISENYTNNMDLYIKNWLVEDIEELRNKINESTFKGYRAKSLEKLLVDNYGTSTKKAKFLARQETTLLVGEYTKQRYQKEGIEKYMWQTSGKSTVRPDHKSLEGKIFSWTDPPVINRATGKRGHPKQDYGCQCYARPVVEFK